MSRTKPLPPKQCLCGNFIANKSHTKCVDCRLAGVDIEASLQSVRIKTHLRKYKRRIWERAKTDVVLNQGTVLDPELY